MEKIKTTYRKFPIDNSINLKAISEKIGISKEQLIKFHNIFATPKQYIGAIPPSELNFLYVPPNFHYLYSGLSLNGGHSLFLYNKPSIELKQYSVEYLHKHDDKQTKINFDVQVQYKKTLNNEFHLFEINKLSQTSLNNEIEENDLQEINEKINKIIYPLQIITNDNGSFKEVVYQDSLKKKWEQLKKELLEEYQGSCFNYIINYNDLIINDKTKFVETYNEFWLLKSLFPSIYSLYNFSGGIYENTTVDLIEDEAPLSYKTFKNFTNIDTKGNLLKFDYKGKLNDSRSRMQLEWVTGNTSFQDFNNQESKGIFEQSIIWDNENKRINSINIQVVIELEKPITNTISIRLMEE